jgi:hypothetical protein
MSRWGAALTCIGLVALLSAGAPGPSATATLPEACHSLPEGEELISGLTTGQIIDDGSTTTLRFADQAYDCDTWPDSMSSHGCASHWAYRLSLPMTALTPGSIDLHAAGADFGYVMNTSTPESGGGCSEEECTSAVNGVGGADVNAGATLEIYSVSAGCITGKLSGLTSLGAGMPMPPVNGTFFAVSCSAT